jgi:HEAT repeat protein
MPISRRAARFLRAAACCFLLAAAGHLHAEESAGALAEKLGSADREVRREAAYQLVKLGAGAREALPALIKALDDQDKQVWSDAVTAIANIGIDAKDAVPALLEDMESQRGRRGRERDRRQALVRAAFALSRIGEPAIPALIAALSSNDNSLRQGAAKALAGMGPEAKSAIPALIANLGHSERDVRREVIDAFARIGEPSVNPLLEALNSTEPLVRESALLALAQLGPAAHAAAGRVIELAATEKDSVVRAALLASLAKIGVEPARAVPLLISGLQESDEAVQHGATNALLLLRTHRQLAVPPLVELVRKRNPAITARAASILGRYEGAAATAVPALLEVVDGGGPEAAACSEALVQIGPPAASAVLGAIEAKDPDTMTREHWSVRILAAIGSRALDAIQQSFASPAVAARLAATRTCTELGLDAADARDGLLKLCADADARVRASSLAAVATLPVEPAQLRSRIETALKDESALVRMTAVQLIPSLGDERRRFAPALIAALKDDAPNVRQAALLAIGPDQPEAVPVLVETLATPAMRGPILAALAKLGATAAPSIPHLVELYPKAEKQDRLAILAIASNSGSNESVALLSGAMKDSDGEIRAAGVRGFARAEPDKGAATAGAIAMLADPDESVRRAAAGALGGLGEPARDSATAPLVALLDHDQDREFALDALRQLRIRTVPTLLPLLDHGDARVRLFACERLGRIGAAARDAVPTLQKLAQGDGQPDYVRREARRAVQQIERQ